jgi:septum formation protein
MTESSEVNEKNAAAKAAEADAPCEVAEADAPCEVAEADAPREGAEADAPREGAEANAPRSFDVILASGSPRRRELLTEAGVNFVVRTPQVPVDESLEPDLAAQPEEAAKKLAERKAGAVIQEVLAENYTGMLMVLGADTMVVLDGHIFGKPRNLSDAKHMLRQLSGRTHEVITAVSVWMVDAPSEEDISLGFRTFADVSHVTFRALTDEEIADYLREGESFDKAGAYAIQGKGASLVERYEGAYDTIVGLPAQRLVREFPQLIEGM